MPNDLGEETVGEMRDRARKNAEFAGYGELYRLICNANITDLIDDPAYWPPFGDGAGSGGIRAAAISKWVKLAHAYTAPPGPDGRRGQP